MFNLEQARRDGNLARGLIWLGPDTFRWCTVSILNGPNEHGQYHVVRIRDGWYGTTDRLRNLTRDQKQDLLLQ